MSVELQHYLNYNRQKLLIATFFFINEKIFPLFFQTSSDGNQTTSTLSTTLSRADAGRYLSCRAYNHAVPSEALEDGWRLDIQCKCNSMKLIDWVCFQC